jgi:hypothetical protein
MSLKTHIDGFTHLPGHNCVTTAIRNILNYYGYRYPESIIFGLAEGLGFRFEIVEGFENPHVSGVGKGLIESFCRNLDMQCDVKQFDDDVTAMNDLKTHINEQIPLIAQVDLFHLPYFASKVHFASHRLIPVGYDDDTIFCADTGFPQIQPCPVDKFVEARRSTFPPFTVNRRRTKIQRPAQRPFVEEMITKSLYNLGQKFDNHQPGYNLLQILSLRDHLDAYKSPALLYTQIEKAGTGGGLSRRLFADFLDQAGQMYSRAAYEVASAFYRESADLWSQIARAAKAGSLSEASVRLERIYEIETEALKILRKFEGEEL